MTMRYSWIGAAALVLAGVLATGAARAGEAGDLVFADRGPWALGDRTLVWSMTHDGPAVPGFAAQDRGSLTLSQALDPSDGKPVLQLDQKSTQRSRRIGPFPTSGGDPVVTFFLESTARDMAALTGGSPDYIRNRIKDAVFRGGEVTGAEGAREVVLRPFADDPNRARMQGFETLEIRFRMGADPRQPIPEMVARTAAPVAVPMPQPAPPGVAPIAPAPYVHALALQ